MLGIFWYFWDVRWTHISHAICTFFGICFGISWHSFFLVDFLTFCFLLVTCALWDIFGNIFGSLTFCRALLTQVSAEISWVLLGKTKMFIYFWHDLYIQWSPGHCPRLLPVLNRLLPRYLQDLEKNIWRSPTRTTSETIRSYLDYANLFHPTKDLRYFCRPLHFLDICRKTHPGSWVSVSCSLHCRGEPWPLSSHSQ